MGAARNHYSVVRNDEVVAYVFIGDVHDDYASGEATKFLETLSNILFGAIDNRRLARQRVAAAAISKEIEIAREVQALLFPRQLPNDAHVALAASYVPHTAVGGDYYDVVAIDDNRFLFCVADVSGKGVAASLLMSNFQAGLRTLLRQHVDLAPMTSELNNLIFRNSGGEKFITVFFGLYDPYHPPAAIRECRPQRPAACARRGASAAPQGRQHHAGRDG
jgi:sigma-B regulation protein RsbU (phosphoserine phosphatase)